MNDRYRMFFASCSPNPLKSLEKFRSEVRKINFGRKYSILPAGRRAGWRIGGPIGGGEPESG